MQALVDGHVQCGRFLKVNDLASLPAYAPWMESKASVSVAESEPPSRALPSTLYRRISVAAWAATMIGGALSWAALFRLV